MDEKRQKRDEQPALQDEGGVVGDEAGDDDFAKRLGRHRRADRRRAERDDGGEADAGEDDGRASGSSTCTSLCVSVMPTPRAASRTEGGMFVSPVSAFSKIGRRP